MNHARSSSDADFSIIFFKATSMDGNYFEITFARDEDKKITKCVILTQGVEVEGIKING